MTTKRKPLPPSAKVFPPEYETGVVRPSTSAATTTSQEAHHDQHRLPIRRRSDGNYFDILETYHSEPIQDDELPSYQEHFYANRPQHRQEFRQAPGDPRIQRAPSTGLTDDEEIINVSSPHTLSMTTTASTNIPSVQTPEPSTPGKRPKLVTALEETSYFLGGLLSHPVETTKYFTILRHSHGLVYYKGPETSLAISIFSTRPIPPSRRLWLQLKGWTGNTGMAAKAFFRSNNSWINVTPDNQVSADSIPPQDERAWQRDIRKFTTKATKTQLKQTLRETVVVRIPFEASDGYFRLVLTTEESRKVLCPSPVFRVASTSMSASSVKGASLKTLPIELTVKAAQVAANIAKTKAVAAATPLIAANGLVTSVTAPVQQYGGYAQTAWDMSGAQDHIDAANEQYEARQEEGIVLDRTASAPTGLRGSVVGDDAGPVSPFPVRFSGIVAKGTGSSTATFDMPTANLDDLPPDLLSSVSPGVYFGWALVVPRDSAQADVHDTWRQAIVTISFITTNTSKIAQRKTVRAYLLHEFPANTLFIGSKLKLSVMGYLRPLTLATETDVFMLETLNDIAITRASLDRPAWSHEQMIRRVKTAQAERGISDRLVDARIVGQRKIDKIPIHKFGVRSDSFGIHDRGMYGNGGVWVKRD